MNDLTRFKPFRGLTLVDPFGREFDDMFKGFFLTPMPLNQLSAGQFPIDVSEDDKNFKVRAELPGFNKEDINVSVTGGQVSITAETKKEKEEKKGSQVVLSECYYGRQSRTFTLPQGVDDAKTTAKYEDGILSLILPKKGNGKNKSIVID